MLNKGKGGGVGGERERIRPLDPPLTFVRLYDTLLVITKGQEVRARSMQGVVG